MARRRSRTIALLALVAACLLLVPAAVGRIAAPDAATAALAVSKEGTGTGRITSLPPGIDCGTTCAASFPDGSSVTLIANADDGSTFVSWSGACSGTGLCPVALPPRDTRDQSRTGSVGEPRVPPG